MSAYRYKLIFQKCLYFNYYLYKVWILVIGMILVKKTEHLGKLTIYLSVTVFTLLVILEIVRLIIGQIATTRNRVPEIGGFLLITSFMQLPLVSFFLFNPYLRNLPVEIILHGSLWVLSIMETVFGYIELKQASALAASVYLAQFKAKNSQPASSDNMKTNTLVHKRF